MRFRMGADADADARCVIGELLDVVTHSRAVQHERGRGEFGQLGMSGEEIGVKSCDCAHVRARRRLLGLVVADYRAGVDHLKEARRPENTD